MLQFGASLTDDSSSVNYDRNMFIIQATALRVINLLSLTLTINKLDRSTSGKPLRPTLMFRSKVGAYRSKVSSIIHMTLLANFRKVRKNALTNTLAYREHSSITDL
jgi:hypothetical protein